MDIHKLEEDNLLYFQLLNINKDYFEKNFRMRVKPDSKTSTCIENDNLFHFIDENNNIICSASWQLLGCYHKIEDQSDENIVDVESYLWIWPWVLFPEDKEPQNIKNYLEKLPDEQKSLSKNIVKLHDPMIISYILSYLNYEMSLEYIYIKFDGEKYFAFGLTKVDWKIPRDPNLERMVNETIIKNMHLETNEDEETKEGSQRGDDSSSETSSETSSENGDNVEKQYKPSWKNIFTLFSSLQQGIKASEDNINNEQIAQSFDKILNRINESFESK